MTREDWLLRAVEELRPLLAEHGAELPAVRVSCGFPRGSRGKGQHAIGQCWYASCSADETHEVFISPELADPARVLDVLAHELVHAALPPGTGHNKVFTRLARAIGLDGKPTATVAGELFTAWATEPLKRLGDYPHAQLTPGAGGGSGPKKQGTRMLKLACPGCGMVIRTTRKWIEEVGPPFCSHMGHESLQFELAD